ncbi:MAG: FG-GAP repeat protein, partial [Candidatus Aminicenantes bacterium]
TGVGWFPPAANLDWTLCGTGDFNNDGKMDLLWRNVSSGQNAVWYMDGVIRIGVESLTTVTTITWEIGN